MKVQSLDFIYLDVPFTEHTNQHMQYWLPNFRIIFTKRLKTGM
jgi:hypothetical protein